MVPEQQQQGKPQQVLGSHTGIQGLATTLLSLPSLTMCWLDPLLQAGATAQPATAPAPAPGSSSSSQLFQLPFWASADRSADIVLNFTAADAAQQQQEAAPVTFRGKPLASVSLRKGYFHGNVAVVRFGGQFITAVRKIQFYLTPRTSVADYPLNTDPSECVCATVPVPCLQLLGGCSHRVLTAWTGMCGEGFRGRVVQQA